MRLSGYYIQLNADLEAAQKVSNVEMVWLLIARRAKTGAVLFHSRAQ